MDTLLAPRQIWVLGETEPADVRKLVPTLPPEFATPTNHAFNSYLQFVTSSTAQIEDYVRLLQSLPTRYPLHSPDIADDKRSAWQKSVRAVYNWICDHIQTGLVERKEIAPMPPKDLQVLAFRGDELVFVRVDDALLVHADDKHLAELWKDKCLRLSINDDWASLREWLGVRRISDAVEAEWQPGNELEAQTQDLAARFRATIPYYLALIQRDQPARYDLVLSRMERLRVHVVDKLSVMATLKTASAVDAIVTEVHVHLLQRADQPNPKGGRPLRAGDLYATPEVFRNPYLLGDLIADYVEIARLGDAFVLLFRETSDLEKSRFLQSKGITQDDLATVFNDMDLEREIETQSAQIQSVLDQVWTETLQKQTTVPATHSTPTARPIPAVNGQSDRTETEEGVDNDGREVTPARFPELDINAVSDVRIVSDGVLTPPSPGSERRHVPSGNESVPSQMLTKEIGRRGEQWAYAAERKRLVGLGFDPDELEEMGILEWVSKTKPTANFDILSMDVTTTGEQHTVYIEVKASTGHGYQIEMAKSEFELALVREDDYRLYFVGHVDQAQPDPPLCYRNFGRLIREKEVDLHVSSIRMRLPAPVSELDPQPGA